MARIEGFRIKNFGTLKDVKLGRTMDDWSNKNVEALTPLTVVIGKNGAGKSSLFDAFGFLSDCLKTNVEEACDSRGRGGFKKIVSQGAEKEAIEFEIYYRQEKDSRPITYELSIALESGRPYVKGERLRQRRKNQSRGRPYSFLFLEKGKGVVWKGENLASKKEEGLLGHVEVLAKEETGEKEVVGLDDNRKLGIANLGSMTKHTRISIFRKFMESWYLSYFTPSAARSLPNAGSHKNLNAEGDNLANFSQFMERDHPNNFRAVLTKIAEKIPGLAKIDTEVSRDDRLLLKFYNEGFDDPFYAQQVSDGTLKMFAYLLLLEDPNPHSFLCIEEPENGLYHQLLEILAKEFKKHAENKSGSQVFVTTHSPHFVDALDPSEVWVLEKGKDGFSTIKRASDDELVCHMVEEGLDLGKLWNSDYLDSSA